MVTLSDIQSFGKSFFKRLTKQINDRETELLYSQISRAKNLNHWFTEDFVKLRLDQICSFLNSEKFISSYSFLPEKNIQKIKTFGIISEENIPLEEFPILLILLLSGNSFIYKINEKSDKLISLFFELLERDLKEFKGKINFTEASLKNVDQFIITGKQERKDNVRKYFEKKESFFDIRYQSVAVLDGNEKPEELKLLGEDIFTYFGMGTGSVKKLFISREYDLKILFQAIEDWSYLIDHNAYANNCQYYRAVYLLNRIPHFDNGFMLFKEDTEMRSPTAVMFYEYFDDKKVLLEKLNNSSNIFRIYISNPVSGKEFKFGESANQLLIPSDRFIRFLQ